MLSFCQIIFQEILLTYTATYEYIFPSTTSPTLVKNINFGRFVSENLYTAFFIDIDLSNSDTEHFCLCSLNFYVVYLLNPLSIFLLKGLHFLMAHKSS